MSADKTVLVTGISGFIAKHCASELLAKGYTVRGTVRNKERARRTRETLERLHPEAAERLTLVDAELTADAGWGEAVKGCAGILHVASPFPMNQPKGRDALVVPARDGALRVLKASARAGVERVVLTSSTAAIIYGHAREHATPFTEANWTNPDAPGVSPYVRSKTLAERAAWDFASSDNSGLTLAVINPGFVLGPALDGDFGTSLAVIQMFLKGKYPRVPRLQFPSVDVRDVAAAHVAALENPAAAGQRYLCTEASYWMVEIGRSLRKALPERRGKIPSRELPDALVRMMGLFDSALRPLLPDLGVEKRTSNAKIVKELGLSFRPAMEAAVASARSVMEFGLA